MPTFKMLGLLLAVLALSAIGVTSSSAAQFTWSAVGKLTGKATETQVFTTNAGQVKCTVAETAGSLTSTAFSEQHVTVTYKTCTAFGFANVHISPATYLFTADGKVHIKNTITINTTLGCHQTVHPQNGLGTVSFINEAGGTMIVTPHVTNIAYTSTGGLCGAAGNNGTYTGNSTWSRVEGGSLSFDP